MSSRRPHGGGARPWLLAVLGGALVAAGVAGHAARSLWRGLGCVPPLLARAEKRAVPAMQGLGRGVSAAVAVGVDVLARALIRLGRGVALAGGAVVEGIAGGIGSLAAAVRLSLTRGEAALVDVLSEAGRGAALLVGAGVHWLAVGSTGAARLARRAGGRARGPAWACARWCGRWGRTAARTAGAAGLGAARTAGAAGLGAARTAGAAGVGTARRAGAAGAAGIGSAVSVSASRGRVAAENVATALDAGGRRAKRWAPHVAKAGMKATAWMGVVGLVAVAVGVPGLWLAASTVDLSGGRPNGNPAGRVLAADRGAEDDTTDGPDPGGEAAFPALDERSTVYAADGTPLAVLHGDVNRRVVDLDAVPAYVVDAVTAAEDRRFYSHDGYDAEGIARAIRANLAEGEIVQGASTITQQLAKQNYVGDEQVLSRKVNELVHAVALEDRFSKEELLERYVNQVYFGAGAYGIAAASEEWFGVTPDKLGVEDAALLAGMIRSPSTLDPRRFPERARDRRNQVLDSMAAAGDLEPAQTEALRETSVGVLPEGPDLVRHPRVVAAVKRAFLGNPAFGDSREQRARLLLAGGLHIHTTIQPDRQRSAGEALDAMLGGSAGPGGALAALDPRTGQIRALHSSTDFAAERFDLATQSRRQPGSAFKPFVLAAALEGGESPEQTLTGTSPSTFEVPGQEDDWEVGNYGGRSWGPVTPDEALVNSVNTAFAELITDVGTEPVIDLARDLGIEEEAFGPEPSRGPSIALGGLTRGVSPLDMASAYGAFANEGVHTTPYLIQRITRDGDTVFNRHPEPRQVLDEDTNEFMVEALTEVVTEGTGTPAELDGREALGKTGTTQQSADAWFVGAVPQLSTAVWVGHPDGQTPVPGLTGSSLPAPLWRQFMERAVADEPVEQFGED